MSQRRVGRMLEAWGVFLGGCLLLSGCQSTTVGSLVGANGTAPGSPSVARSSPAPRPAVLTQGMEVDWALRTSQEAPGLVKQGRGLIGPDGAMVLGPYGSCKVAGLTVEQANKAIEKHLSAFVKQPSVALYVPTPTPPPATENLAWRPTASKTGPQTMTARSSAPPVREAVSRVAFQPANGKPVEPKDNPETAPAPRELHPMVAPPTGPLLSAPVEVGPVPAVAPKPPMPHPVLPPAPDELQRVLLPPYVVGPSDVLQIESLHQTRQPVRGPHLVRPDGSVGLGIYGSILVAGLTLEQIKDVVARAIYLHLDPEEVKYKDVYEGVFVDVLAYNSKVYYVITDNAGQGEAVLSFPVTGNETVLDAISKVGGLPPVASKRDIFVARRTTLGHAEARLPVDWVAITQGGSTHTNWQIMPGDRIYVKSDRWYTADRNLAKILSPFERIFGITLLGSQTVNSIRGGGVGFGGGGFR